MQLLFALSFALTVATSLFIGRAMSEGYAPYASAGAALFYMIAMFLPFLSEYNVVHRGFSKIGGNFSKLMKSDKEEPAKGEVEIILPSGSPQARAEDYDLDRPKQSFYGVIFVILVASGLLGYDLTQFFILGDGLASDSGPISNF